VRYAKARELLAVTDMPIGEIEHAPSYATHPRFIAAFLKRRHPVGMAPRDP
jgi:AraC-like DNA-binding protein